MENSHFAASLIWDVIDGERHWLVFAYYPTERDWYNKRNSQIKFPGGGNNEFQGETPIQTSQRECVGEIGLWTPDDAFLVYTSEPKPSDRGAGTHTQYFFVSHIEDCSGVLRKTEPFVDQGAYLSKPRMIPEKALLEAIFPSHKPGLEAAISYLDGGGVSPPPRPVMI